MYGCLFRRWAVGEWCSRFLGDYHCAEDQPYFVYRKFSLLLEEFLEQFLLSSFSQLPLFQPLLLFKSISLRFLHQFVQLWPSLLISVSLWFLAFCLGKKVFFSEWAVFDAYLHTLSGPYKVRGVRGTVRGVRGTQKKKKNLKNIFKNIKNI